jgi:dolichol-phosphate mannosyltransferase
LRIAVVIPAYNEAENLPRLFSALFALPLDLHVLVVDDNSPDGTGRVADELAAAHPDRVRVLHREGKLGFSSAYLQGFRLVLEDPSIEAVAQMDADFSHDPSALPAMAAKLADCDVVLGSRYVKGGGVDRRWSFWRKGLSAWANFYARTLLGMKQRDVTTGYRLWRREALEGIPFRRIQANGYIFLVEMAYLAHCLKYRFGEVPIYFADRRFGKSKMSFRIQVEAALRVWQVLWAYRDVHRLGEKARIKR